MAVFDGDFWHGYDYDGRRLRQRYWRDKIEGNTKRDLGHAKAQARGVFGGSPVGARHRAEARYVHPVILRIARSRAPQ